MAKVPSANMQIPVGMEMLALAGVDDPQSFAHAKTKLVFQGIGSREKPITYSIEAREVIPHLAQQMIAVRERMKAEKMPISEEFHPDSGDSWQIVYALAEDGTLTKTYSLENLDLAKVSLSPQNVLEVINVTRGALVDRGLLPDEPVQ